MLSFLNKIFGLNCHNCQKTSVLSNRYFFFPKKQCENCGQDFIESGLGFLPKYAGLIMFVIQLSFFATIYYYNPFIKNPYIGIPCLVFLVWFFVNFIFGNLYRRIRLRKQAVDEFEKNKPNATYDYWKIRILYKNIGAVCPSCKEGYLFNGWLKFYNKCECCGKNFQNSLMKISNIIWIVGILVIQIPITFLVSNLVGFGFVYQPNIGIIIVAILWFLLIILLSNKSKKEIQNNL